MMLTIRRTQIALLLPHSRLIRWGARLSSLGHVRAMSVSLHKRWEVTRQRLDEAYQVLQGLRSDTEAQSCFSEYRDMLDHNEPELALDALEHLADSSDLPASVWEAFAVAAESMDLQDGAAACRKMKVGIL